MGGEIVNEYNQFIRFREFEKLVAMQATQPFNYALEVVDANHRVRDVWIDNAGHAFTSRDIRRISLKESFAQETGVDIYG